MNRTAIIWVFLFAMILVLSQAGIFVAFTNELAWFGFPAWLWFMMALHTLYVILLFVFSGKEDRSS